MDKKINEDDIQKVYNELDLKENYDTGWFLVILIIFIFGFKTEQKLDRKDLLEKVNNSDLSNTEKRKIMEILLG